MTARTRNRSVEHRAWQRALSVDAFSALGCPRVVLSQLSEPTPPGLATGYGAYSQHTHTQHHAHSTPPTHTPRTPTAHQPSVPYRSLPPPSPVSGFNQCLVRITAERSSPKDLPITARAWARCDESSLEPCVEESRTDDTYSCAVLNSTSTELNPRRSDHPHEFARHSDCICAQHHHQNSRRFPPPPHYPQKGAWLRWPLWLARLLPTLFMARLLLCSPWEMEARNGKTKQRLPRPNTQGRCVFWSSIQYVHT